MTSSTKRQLSLVSYSPNSKIFNCADLEPCHIEPFGKGTLSLLEQRSSGEGHVSNMAKFLTLLDKVKLQNSIVQLTHDVEVELFDDKGNGFVCFKFDLANYGTEPLYERVHRFWFANPQHNFNIEVISEANEKLSFDYTECTPTRKEMKVVFPRPVESAENLKYRIQFSVEDGFTGNFYDISARTFTNKISFSLLCPPNMRLNEKRVVRETAGGFLEKNPPFISLSLEHEREKLSWQLRNPKLGDQFRTHWSFA